MSDEDPSSLGLLGGDWVVQQRVQTKVAVDEACDVIGADANDFGVKLDKAIVSLLSIVVGDTGRLSAEQ
jgi:hypothetical protein